MLWQGVTTKKTDINSIGHQKPGSTIGSVYYVIVVVLVSRDLGQRYETYDYIDICTHIYIYIYIKH